MEKSFIDPFTCQHDNSGHVSFQYIDQKNQNSTPHLLCKGMDSDSFLVEEASNYS